MPFGQEPNGMKLAPTRVLDQPLTQFLPGCDHERKAFRSSFLDARLHTMGADRVHDQRREWHIRLWCAEPSQGIPEADPLHAHMLERR